MLWALSTSLGVTENKSNMVPALPQLEALRKRVLTSSNGAMHLSTSRGQHEIRVTKDLWAEQSWNPKEEKPAKLSKGLGGRGHWDMVYTSISQVLLCGFRLGLGPSINNAQAGLSVS